MAVHKSLARLVDADGEVIGEGRAYLHLRLPKEEPQRASGTLSLDWWDESRTTSGARLDLVDGPRLSLVSGETGEGLGMLWRSIVRHVQGRPEGGGDGP